MQEKRMDVNQLNSIADNKNIDRVNWQNTLKILEQRPLQEKINYQNLKGEKFESSIREILFHIGNHFTHHRAQIMMYLRQNGIEPLITDYIFYKRKRND
ncbi:MAG: DinB family protein [Cyclobacteriaceae bacterium]